MLPPQCPGEGGRKHDSGPGERLRTSLAEVRPRFVSTRVELSRDRLNKLAALPNVHSVVPLVYNGGVAFLGKKSGGVQVLSARPNDEASRAESSPGAISTARTSTRSW